MNQKTLTKLEYYKITALFRIHTNQRILFPSPRTFTFIGQNTIPKIIFTTSIP